MAAGNGVRFGEKKQFLKLENKTLVSISANLFKDIKEIKDIFIVYPENMKEEEVRVKAKLNDDVKFVKGAGLRADSVQNGLRKVKSEYVLIHDAVRPFCSKNLINRVISTTLKYGAAAPGLNPVSSVKYFENGILKNINRNNVFIIQTPQGFRSSEIINAYEKKRHMGYTDSSSIVMDSGIEVKMVAGEESNIKITFPEDYQKILRGCK